MNGYCVRCKTQREMTNPVEFRSKIDRKMVRGVCLVCGTKMTKILPSTPA